MTILVACEFTGTVRDALIARGHEAVSCDLLESEKPGPHIRGDALAAMRSRRWDMMIAFPPCTHLALSGARWLVDHWIKRKNKPPRWHDGSTKRVSQKTAVQFFRTLLEYGDIPKRCIENPMSMASRLVAPKSQTIHPWQFGHPEQKTTWLWLRNLPFLRQTNNVHDEMMALPKNQRERIWSMAPGEDRQKERSRSFAGIAAAMAEQWGKL